MGNLNQKRRCSSLHEYFQGTVGERIQDLLREKKMTQGGSGAADADFQSNAEPIYH